MSTSDTVQMAAMTEEEERSQRQLQARINRRLDREKEFRELHPGESTPLYDCSMGLSKILESISAASLYRDDRRQTFDVFLFNALTFARNCYDKHRSRTDTYRAIQKDLQLFVRYVQVYFSDQKELTEKPYICIYLPEYSLKDIYLRPPNEERSKVLSLARDLFKRICTNPPLQQQLGNCTLYTAKVGMTTLPHRDLAVLLSKWDRGVMRPTQRRYLLISHIPLDFHLQNTLQNKLYILESYTGKIKSCKDLGEKVFKEQGIPFNQYTHLLFGDKVLIKPLVMRATKKRMLELARSKHWMSRPLSLILSDIQSTQSIPSSVLTAMKF